ncbi:hypothetical protein HP548_02560 [Paenibacillus taichungensis]|uniref:Uncharacterized protein n=2 Tax=Bacillales TaxID=1385 RepID=A0ABX2MIN7_9BACL|nr:hypothetical protein [Paenibacillus taichungensis]NUU52977.1 hypothetical protein [Paenibacillus taichungensis]
MDNNLKADFVSSITDNEYDELLVQFEDCDWSWMEMERPRYRNVREKLGLILELIQDSDQVIRDQMPPRTKYEMNGGIKIAIRRGARLQEVDVYNLYFRFRSHLPGDGLALMYKSPRTNKEIIILLPDRTEIRIEKERILYKEEARNLVFKGLMDPDTQSELLENLSLLNLHERCAQSLQHEYGHVLNVRAFEALNISPGDEQNIYKWFLESGYLHNVDKRYPDFGSLRALDKLHVLKESLVEDYRISLNINAERGKFILPNKYSFSGDFQKPLLLKEGVDLMKRMLNKQLQVTARRPASSSDYDTIKAYRSVVSRREKLNWSAGNPSITDEIINRDLDELKHLASSQVASTK